MTKTIDMQGMRYLNLFEKITRTRTRFFFYYNNMIIFCVPKAMLSQSLGKNNSNLKKISDIVKKKIRIVAIPLKIEDAERFIQAIINPFTFKNLEISANEMILTAGAQNKAALIGRDKRRLIEMQRITRDFFNRELKIV
jgi:transcription antitermination factor NusA-like protein